MHSGTSLHWLVRVVDESAGQTLAEEERSRKPSRGWVSMR